MSQIVVIEGDRNLQNSFNERLTAAGFQVVCANNRRIGLWTVQQCQPDIVLSDIDMPEMEGYEQIPYPLSFSHVSLGQRTHFLFRKASHNKNKQLARPSASKMQPSQTNPEAIRTYSS